MHTNLNSYILAYIHSCWQAQKRRVFPQQKESAEKRGFQPVGECGILQIQPLLHRAAGQSLPPMCDEGNPNLNDRL